MKLIKRTVVTAGGVSRVSYVVTRIREFPLLFLLISVISATISIIIASVPTTVHLQTESWFFFFVLLASICFLVFLALAINLGFTDNEEFDSLREVRFYMKHGSRSVEKEEVIR